MTSSSTYIHNYSPVTPEEWPSREGVAPFEHIFQIVEHVDLQREEFPTPDKTSYGLIGFCCDIGVVRNQGRPGAAHGPFQFRPAIALQAWHGGDTQRIYDLGDVVIPDEDLALAQSALGQMVEQCHKHNMISVVVGGGNELSYGHYQGLAAAFPDKKIGVINFDAHFDMRPLTPEGNGTSGTPFLEIAQHAAEHDREFNYLVLGIQPYANTASLVKTAKAHNVKYILADDLRNQSNAAANKVLNEFLDEMDVIYLTMDLDVFATACAPGVSSSQALGLYPYAILPMFTHIAKSGKVIGFDIAELAPRYDIEGRTAFLCANLVNHFLHHNQHRYTRSES